MKWIEAKDIRQWPVRNSRECQAKSPILLRMLLQASSDDLYDIDIPGDDSLAYGGFDGYFELKKDITYLKKGKYVVEVGTNDKIRLKADKDYEASFSKTLIHCSEDITFLFFTPRLFSKSDEWIIEKKEEKKSYWKDIRVINAPIIEQWIELNPSVGAWLAIDMKLVFGHSGIVSLNEWWNRHFVKSNGTFIDKSTLLVNREKNVENLINSLNQPRFHTIESPSTLESMAFCVSAIESKDELLSKSCIVSNDQILFDSGLYRNSFLFITDQCSFPAIESAVKNGHSVILCRDKYTNNDSMSPIKLETPERYKFATSLEKSGFSFRKGATLAQDCFREIRVLLYLLDFDDFQFYWNNIESLKMLKTAALLGSWNTDYEGDKMIVEILSNYPYDEYIALLQPFINKKDSPIAHVGKIYKIKYHGLVHSIFSQDEILYNFEELQALYEEVLLQKNPLLDLEPLARPWAKFRGTKPSTSIDVQKGILYSLIHIAINNKGQINQSKVDLIIQSILSKKDQDILKSNSRLLSLFAEASPSSFLSYLENKIGNKANEIINLFREEEFGALSPNVYHTTLLRALESLAWFPNYYEDSINCLLGLAELDPGGRVSNRPINSLRNINFLWLPYTYVNQNDRYKVLKRASKNHPQIVADVLCSILNHNSSVWSTASFEYRQAQMEKREINDFQALKDTYEIINDIKDKLSEENYINFLQRSLDFTVSFKEKFLKIIKNALRANPNYKKLYNSLGRIICVYSMTKEKKPENKNYNIELYERVYDELKSYFPLEEIKSAYSLGLKYTRGSKRFESHEKEQELQQKLRIALLKDMTSLKTNKLCDLAKHIENKRYFGIDLGKCLDEKDNLIFLKYCLEEEQYFEILLGFCAQKRKLQNEEYIRSLYEQLVKLIPERTASVLPLCTLDNSKNLWSEIEDLGRNKERLYWNYMYEYQIPEDIEGIKIMINKLIEFDRHHSTLWIVYRSKSILSTIDLLNYLYKLGIGEIKNTKPQRLDGHEISEIIEELYKRDLEEYDNLATHIDLLYFELISNSHYQGKFPTYLGKKMSTSPEFVIQLFEWHSEVYSENDDKNVDRAMKCWKILNEFSSSYLLEGKDGLQIEKFEKYCIDLRSLANEKKQMELADQLIGELIGCFPKSENWPDDWICELLLKLDSERINNFFSFSSSNGKGVRVSWGGKGSRELRAQRKYEEYKDYSERIRFKYPKISKLLKERSDHYFNKIERMKTLEMQDDLRQLI